MRQRMQAFLARWIPTNRITVQNPWADQPSITQHLSAERVQEIIQSAQAGDPRDLFALYRDIVLTDSHIQAELNKRKLAVIGDALTVTPKDKKNPDDVVAAKVINDLIEDLTVPDPADPASCSWLRACIHLMDSTLFPVAVVEKVFTPSEKPGLRFQLKQLIAVPHYLLTYVTNQEDFTGLLKIREVNNLGINTGVTNEVDTFRYIVHRGNMLTAHDVWGGPMRAVVFWWLLSTMDREWWARFLERYGSPFIVGKYNQGDDASRSVLERAFSYAVKIGGLVITKDTQVELMQASSSQSGDGYEKFIRICNEEKSKLILGQTLSAESRNTGLGSGIAKQHGNVRDDYRQFDAKMLASVMEEQLFKQYLQINQLPGRVKLLWGSVGNDEKESLGNILVDLKQAGLEPADEALENISELLGFQVQRAPASPSSPMPSMALHALAARGELPTDLVDLVAANGSAKLARTFRGSLAPVRKMILASASPADLEKKLREFYADWDPDQVAEVVDQALVAFAANGAASVK
jgi:phage gp29-like protein